MKARTVQIIKYSFTENITVEDCRKCNKTNPPYINDKGIILHYTKCPNRACRAPNWREFKKVKKFTVSYTIQSCRNCGKINVPKINPNGTLTYPKHCKSCRSTAWNWADEQWNQSREKRNKNLLLGHKVRRINTNIQKKFRATISNYNKKQKKMKKKYFVCKTCDRFYETELELLKHNERRHINEN